MRKVWAVLIATLWISLSEFVRNEFLLKSYWVDHYADLGLKFPSEPVNGMVWGIWSLCFAILIYLLSRKFEFWQTVVISWFAGFVLMWIVIGNMAVLPLGILPVAVPLSLLEAFLATWIIGKVSPVPA
jgi:hypothetical protein